jgi:hypothetical protein
MALTAAGMAAAMETAFLEQWSSAKDEDLSGFGQVERRILFTGIALGILRYMEANQNGVARSITLEQGGASQAWNVTALDLNI